MIEMRFIANIEVRDNTRNAKKLPLEARIFHDPADRRLAMRISFKNVPDPFINLLIREIDSTEDVKSLVHEKVEYYAEFLSDKTYGHDIGIERRFLFLPISQKLEIGTLFTLTAENPSAASPLEHGIYCVTVLSDKIKPVKTIHKDIVPFNRRVFLATLLPNEKIQATLIVKKAPENASIRRRTWWARPYPSILEFETQLDDRPDQLLYDIASRVLSRFDEEPYFEQIQLEEADRKIFKAALEELKKEMAKMLSKPYIAKQKGGAIDDEDFIDRLRDRMSQPLVESILSYFTELFSDKTLVNSLTKTVFEMEESFKQILCKLVELARNSSINTFDIKRFDKFKNVSYGSLHDAEDSAELLVLDDCILNETTLPMLIKVLRNNGHLIIRKSNDILYELRHFIGSVIVHKLMTVDEYIHSPMHKSENIGHLLGSVGFKQLNEDDDYILFKLELSS